MDGRPASEAPECMRAKERRANSNSTADGSGIDVGIVLHVRYTEDECRFTVSAARRPRDASTNNGGDDSEAMAANFDEYNNSADYGYGR